MKHRNTTILELEAKYKIKIDLENINTVGEFQQTFNEIFPYLKIIFIRPGNNSKRSLKHELSPTTLFKDLNLKRAVSFFVDKNGSIRDFENYTREQLGAEVQIFRKAGSHWLDTLYTNDWSIEKQNEVGRELSAPGE